MRLLDDDELERSAVAVKCRMNRERNLLGSHGHDRELGLDPLAFLKERTTGGGTAAWLHLCRDPGRALTQAAEIVGSKQLAIDIVGVDIVGMFDPTPPDLFRPRLVQASLSTWQPGWAFVLITCVHGLHYIGADDAAGPKSTRQPAVDSLSEVVEEVRR